MTLTSNLYKTVAEVLLLLPTILLVVLGIGEIAGGDTSGLQHFLQLIPFMVFAILSWRYPKVGGVILATVATILSILYFLFFTDFPPLIRALNSLLLFLPPVVAGMLFFVSQLDERMEVKQ